MKTKLPKLRNGTDPNPKHQKMADNFATIPLRPKPNTRGEHSAKGAMPSQDAGGPSLPQALQRRLDAAFDFANTDPETQMNQGGLPATIKNGIEHLSGMSMDNVQVHYNSNKPAQLQALAYTQGSDIHVAPGQERHLPHEAWHVVQQRQGRVKPTIALNGNPINDNPGLEKEADVMGNRALQMKPNPTDADQVSTEGQSMPSAFPALQAKRDLRYGPPVPSSSATIQRTITLTEQDKTFNNAGNTIAYLTQNFAVKIHQFEDKQWEALNNWNKENKVFKSATDLLNALFPEEESGEEELDLEDVNFNPGLWPKSEKLPKTILNMKYTKGEDIRGDMDYKSSDKSAFAVEEDEDLALIIRMQRPPKSGDISQEVKTLKTLGKQMPTAQIIDTGAYVIGQNAYPAMIMKRYAGSSKELMRQKKGDITFHDNIKKNVARLFPTLDTTKNGLESLGIILSTVKQTGVNDIQFLIDSDGRFVVNDANEVDKKHVESNVLLLQALRYTLNERQKDLLKEQKKEKVQLEKPSSISGSFEIQEEQEEVIDLKKVRLVNRILKLTPKEALKGINIQEYKLELMEESLEELQQELIYLTAAQEVGDI